METQKYRGCGRKCKTCADHECPLATDSNVPGVALKALAWGLRNGVTYKLKHPYGGRITVIDEKDAPAPPKHQRGPM
jgi:hypothetical protein